MEVDTTLQHIYVGQDIENLRFALYERRLDPNLFRIFEGRTIERDSYRADFWIIGSSHVVNVETERASLAEVISGDSRVLPSDDRVELIRDFDNHRYNRRIADEFNYRVELQLLNAPEENLLPNEPAPPDQGILFRLRHRFPTREDIAVTPITAIDVLKADETGIELKTFHSYIEAPAVVVTRSTIEIAAEDGR